MLLSLLFLTFLTFTYGCSQNETELYIQRYHNIDTINFEGYIDLNIIHPSLPELSPAIYLSSSLHISVINSLNNTFYTYIHGKNYLMKDVWTGPITVINRSNREPIQVSTEVRIVSMFPSTLTTNITMLFVQCISQSDENTGSTWILAGISVFIWLFIIYLRSHQGSAGLI